MELSKYKRYFKYALTAKIIKIVVVVAVLLVSNSCKISYQFNGASIDYAKIKSISIADFTNNAELVYAPLASEFSENLRDYYTKNTRLQVIKKNGDMNLEGEIIGYELTPLAISSDTYASQTKLTVTINVRYTNNKNPEDDFEKKYTAYQTFDSSQMLNDVQDDLLTTIMSDICESIFNDTAGKW